MSKETKIVAKVSGYLEKKGRLRMVSSWKKYWFVLEGRLLLYYKSKVEYEAIRPCKGSITLNSPCNLKPALASTCTFQIESRTNTITLRAENRLEQDKWMQAILTALNQSTGSPTRMTHFRYSADDLLPSPTVDNTNKTALIRHNTLPERFPKLPEKQTSVKVRENSHHGSQQNINRSSKSPKLPKNENLKRLLKSNSKEDVQYAKVDKNKKEKEVIVENSEYSSFEDNKGKTSRKIEVLIENSEYVTGGTTEEKVENTRESVLVENSEYAFYGNKSDKDLTEDKEEKNSSEDLENSEYQVYNGGKDVEMAENSEYEEVPYYGENLKTSNLNETKKRNSEIVESIEYEEAPIYNDKVKYREKTQEEDNKKSTERISSNSNQRNSIKDTHIYQEIAQTTEYQEISPSESKKTEYEEISAYDKIRRVTSQLLDHNKNVSRNSESIYDEPTNCRKSASCIKEHSEPDLPPRPVLERSKSNEEKLVKSEKCNHRRFNSFMCRMFKRNKKHSSGKAAEKVCENVGKEKSGMKQSPEEKEIMIKELKALQALLDSKKSLLKHKGSEVAKSSSMEDIGTEKNDSRPSVVTGNEVVILQEFISLLNKKKQVLKEKLNESSENISNSDGNCRKSSEAKVIPKVPPKIKVLPQSDNLKTLTIPRPKLKRHRRSFENVSDKLKTIDEILDDLDKERPSNVKDLIARFDVKRNHDEVVLRMKTKVIEENANRHSDDLNRLLDELSKVTNAPILTPGVTSSLITTPLSDEEWIHLIPIRKRRHSEPDYDVPRPHSSLQILPSHEENNIPIIPTRFFGPVVMDTNNGDAMDRFHSIAPDSLEIHALKHLEDERSFSYTSHNYKEMKTLDRKLSREEIYSRPRSLANECENEDRNVDDQFEDSLEPTEVLNI